MFGRNPGTGPGSFRPARNPFSNENSKMSPSLSIDLATPSDYDYIRGVLESLDKEAYGICNERARAAMTWLICNDSRYQVTIVARVDGNASGFYVAIFDLTRFWQEFIKRYGTLGFLWEKIKPKKKDKNIPGPDIEGESIDEKFLEMSRDRYKTLPGKGYCYYVYVDPDKRGMSLATQLLRDIETRLRERGGNRIETEILAENTASKKLHEKCGYDVRSIGEIWYAVKPLQ